MKNSSVCVMVILLMMTALIAVTPPSGTGDSVAGEDTSESTEDYTYYWILGQLPNQTHVYMYAREGANVTFNGTIAAPVYITVPPDQFVWYNVGDLGYNDTGIEWYFLEMSSDKPLMVNFDRAVYVRTGSSTYEWKHGDMLHNRPMTGLNKTFFIPYPGSGPGDDRLIMYAHERTNVTVRYFSNSGIVAWDTVVVDGLFVSDYIEAWFGIIEVGYSLTLIADENPIAAACFDELAWWPNTVWLSGYLFSGARYTELYTEYLHIHSSTTEYHSFYTPGPNTFEYYDHFNNLVNTDTYFSEEARLIYYSNLGYALYPDPFLAHIKAYAPYADVDMSPTEWYVNDAAAYMGWNSSSGTLGLYTVNDTHVQIYNGRDHTLINEFDMDANTIFRDTMANLGFNPDQPFLATVVAEEPIYQSVKIPFYLRAYPVEIAPPLAPRPPFLYINASANGKDAILNWDPPPTPDTAYYLMYRSTSQTDFDFNTIWVNTSTDINPITGTIDPLYAMWIDSNVTNESHPDYRQEYYYTIRAVNAFGLRSTTSNTVGYYIIQFNTGLNTFSLPLQPFGTLSLDVIMNDMGAATISWLDDNDEWQTHPSIPLAPTAEMGKGYVVEFDTRARHVFTGEPASMIIYKEGWGFDSGPPGSVVTATTAGGDVSLTWPNLGAGIQYYLYWSDTRDGFFPGAPGSYSVLNGGLPVTGTSYQHVGAVFTAGENYYMIVPTNPVDGSSGSSTYSVGIITLDFNGNEMFGTPLKPVWGDQSADWYVDLVSNCLGMIYLENGIWIPHFDEFDAGVYDTIIVYGRGYEITVYSATIFSFVGW